MGDWTRVKQASNPFQPLATKSEDVEVDLSTFEAKVHLNYIGEEGLAKIKEIETPEPLSSKSEMIVKHTKLLRR